MLENGYEIAQDYQIKELEKWLAEDENIFGRTFSLMNRPVQKAMNSVPEKYKVMARNSTQAVLDSLSNIADKIAFSDDIRNEVENLDFLGRDKVADKYRSRNIAACTTLGAGDGLGWAAFVVTLPTLMTLQTKMISQIGTAYGYDMESAEEKINSWLILQLADTHGEQRIKLMEDMMLNSTLFAGIDISVALTKITQQATLDIVKKNLEAVVKKMVGGEVAKRAAFGSGAIKAGFFLFDGGILGHIISNQSHAIARYISQATVGSYSDRLLSRKALTSIPGIGAILGAGFNYWYTSRNANSAMQYYRLRYLHDHCILDFKKFNIRDLETILTDLSSFEETVNAKEIELSK